MIQESNPKGVLNANYSDNRAKKRELFFRYRVRATAVIEAKQRHAPGDSPIRLLDLGAADGKTLAFMAQSLPIKEAIGVEYNQDLINCADGPLQGIDNTRLIRGDVSHLEAFPDNSYDLVTALALLEHISDPSTVIKEATRVLKPGGLFVASSPIPFWDHLAVKTGLLKEDHHECDMYPKRFRGFFSMQAELEIIEYRRFMFAPVGVLAYLGIQPSPAGSLAIDSFFSFFRIFDPLFVNQLIVVRKAS